MLILAIETSCDETSAAVVKDGRTILSNVVSSQIAIHRQFHGVVPELASRAHIENINAVVAAALHEAKIPLALLGEKLDAIAYTRGPGLAGALLVGQVAARTMAFLSGLPLIDVNHLEGHLYAALLEHKKLEPPYLALIVSGGHTELVIVEGYGQYHFLGGTRDDAAGEAFDKVAKLLGLSYPGGPVIQKRARTGNPTAIKFPRPYLEGTWDFSFSGLKTAVVNHVNTTAGKSRTTAMINDVCASFQAAVVDTLCAKTLAAAEKFKLKNIVVGGGVSANTALRETLQKRAHAVKRNVFLPSIALCTDNAAMIAAAGYLKYRQLGESAGATAAQKIEPGMRLTNWY
jgi:N6-L-threonylcarbamoyladenine synthase